MNAKRTTSARLSALLAATVIAAFSSNIAHASTVIPLNPFNVTGPTDFEGNVEIDVNEITDIASFTFSTTAGNSTTSIARIYFETDLGMILSGTPSLIPSGSGVSFTVGTGGPGPNDPPAGNEAPSVPWGGTFERFKADAPPPRNGINVGEYLTIHYDYSGTEADLVDKIVDELGNNRLAVHILNCQGTNSCVATTVPIPAAVWLFGSGLLGLVGISRRKRSA